MKPFRILLFTLAVFACLSAVMVAFPEEGIQITNDLSLKFPTEEEFFFEEGPEYKDISYILNLELDTASDHMVDSTAIKAEMSRKKAIQDSIRKSHRFLKYPDNDKSILHPFFVQLDKLRRSKNHIRVLHYGDSQIEGDRISGYIRYHLQRKFGGSGPGLIPAMQPIPSIAVEQSASENWKRYTIFGRQDSAVTHNRYGVLASFSRFTPIIPDSLPVPEDITEAWITVKQSHKAYANCKEYDYCKMYYGYNRKDVVTGFYIGEELLRTDTLHAGSELRQVQWDFATTPEEFTIRFVGSDSPEIYALALDSKTGIAVDNIPMRGSAGTIFRKIDQQLLKQQYADLNLKLLILQFGGNVMPYIKTTEECERYGRWFKQQMLRLKSLRPDVCIIVIGPSDMSIKDKDMFITYPHLQMVRDALKKATFEAGGAYWDLYEAMGGKNSMPSWVNADPPLAASDYIHFSPKGARKVAELFYSALIKDYEEYKQLNN